MTSENRNIEKGFGFTAEMNEKIKANYSLEDEKLIWSWFRDLGLEVASSSGPDAFRNHLCSGELLCSLANMLQPHSISSIHKTANIAMTAFLNMRSQENISFFITWCIKYGLKKEVIFQIPMLFDSQNLAAVQRTLFQVGSLAQKNGFKGAIVGARMSSSNRRDFTEECLRQAEMEPTKIAGGSNWSQKNTAGVCYGMRRPLLPGITGTGQKNKKLFVQGDKGVYNSNSEGESGSDVYSEEDHARAMF